MGKTNIIVNGSYIDGKVTKQYGLHFKEEIYKIKTVESLFGFKCLDATDVRSINNLVF